MKTLYFEGAGCSNADISKATIGNCRIRTAFHLDDHRAIYLEITCAERIRCPLPLCQWHYIGFVSCCHYITDDIPNDDASKHKIRVINHHWALSWTFEYTEAEILRIVNSLGASIDAIKILPSLGGYRVFPEAKCCQGSGGYYYGDQFQFEPELFARREAVYQYYFMLEKAEGQKSPNFSLWVDEFDPGLLHLLRHFPGTFQPAHNTHWAIRVDMGGTVENWIATATETHLGKYGC